MLRRVIASRASKAVASSSSVIGSAVITALDRSHHVDHVGDDPVAQVAVGQDSGQFAALGDQQAGNLILAHDPRGIPQRRGTLRRDRMASR